MANSMVEILGIGAGIITSVSSLPQMIKIIREKKAEDVSLKMLLLLILGVGLWIAYGFFKNDIPIIVTNILSLGINIAVLVLRIKYGD